MKDLFSNLIPQGRRGLSLWFVLLMALYGSYYFAGPYSEFERWYYDSERHPDREQNLRFQQAENPMLHVGISRIRAIIPIADFLENPVVITVQNLTNESQTAVVQLEVVPNTTSTASVYPPRVYIRTPLMARFQDTVILEDIPPRANVQASFMVRIADGEFGSEYPLQIKLNSEDLDYGLQFAFRYAPHERLRMWLVSQLLLPPGADIFIPLVTMLFSSWLIAVCTELKRKQGVRLFNNIKLNPVDMFRRLIEFLKKLQRDDAFRKDWFLGVGRGLLPLFPWLFMMLFVSAVAFLSLPERLSWLMLGVFWVGTLCCFFPPLHNYFGVEARVKILVAAGNLAWGTKIESHMLKSKPVNLRDLVYTDSDRPLIVGKTLTQKISVDSPLFERDVT